MKKRSKKIPEVVPHYIVDNVGKKIGVILDMVTFDKLIEEIEDIYFGAIAQAALQRETEFLSHDEVKKLFGECRGNHVPNATTKKAIKNAKDGKNLTQIEDLSVLTKNFGL